jgi:rhodanese-related sulfurtransferase
MNSITVAQLAAQPRRTVVDVREPDEFSTGHVPGALNVPLGQLPSRIGDLPVGEPLEVICQSGRRSAQAVEALQAHGVLATNVTGGTAAWIEADLPVQTEAQ